MAKVVVSPLLKDAIFKKFKQQSIPIFDLMKSLESQPHKGKLLGEVGGVIIKEIKYKSFRFYFITDGYILKFGSEDEIAQLVIKFVRMSDKKNQDSIIKEIKKILSSLGFDIM